MFQYFPLWCRFAHFVNLSKKLHFYLAYIKVEFYKEMSMFLDEKTMTSSQVEGTIILKLRTDKFSQ